jgi:hypothetical protein
VKEENKGMILIKFFLATVGVVLGFYAALAIMAATIGALSDGVSLRLSDSASGDVLLLVGTGFALLVARGLYLKFRLKRRIKA